MDVAVVSLLAALAGLVVQGIAIAQALARLRWRRRGLLARRSCVVTPAGELPGGDRLTELRADGGGSEVHLVITRVAEPSERPS